MGRIPGPISICPNPSSDWGYALALTNLFRQSFSQGELKGGRNWNYHWKDSRAHQYLPKPSRRLRHMQLILSIYLDRVLVKENLKEGETETITERIPGPISTCHSPAGVWGWCFWSHKLFDLDRHNFSQGELEGGINWNYHGKDSRAHQHLPKPIQWLRLCFGSHQFI